MQMTLSTSLEEAPVGFCLLRCSHSQHCLCRDELRQQTQGLSKASQELCRHGPGTSGTEWTVLLMQTNVQTQALLGARRAPWPGLWKMNVQPGARGWASSTGQPLGRLSAQNTNDTPSPTPESCFPLLSQALFPLSPPPFLLPPGLQAKPLAQTVSRTARCLDSVPCIAVVASRRARPRLGSPSPPAASPTYPE